MHQSDSLQQFTLRHAIDDLGPDTRNHLYRGDFELAKAEQFSRFYRRIESTVFNHPVITRNTYTPWFSHAKLNSDEIRHFLVQFSVFSNQFLIAQLNKVVNAHSLEEMRTSKEILANEIGVAFNNPQKQNASKLGATEGSIEGGTFHFGAAHFEILAATAKPLGLEFSDLGRREHGTPSTLFFCDELIRLYGSCHYATAEAASFAVEHWAAAGFWAELITGLKNFKKTEGIKLPLTFFTWHNKIEENHARHTKEELEHYYFNSDIDEDAFIDDALEMLDGVYAFWKGLDYYRQRKH